MSIEIFMDHVGDALAGVIVTHGLKAQPHQAAELAVGYAAETYLASYAAYNAFAAIWEKEIHKRADQLKKDGWFKEPPLEPGRLATEPEKPDEGRVSITKEKHRNAIKMIERIKVAVQATWAGHGTVSDINEMANSAVENLKGGAKDL